jgi:hypothetical protein
MANKRSTFKRETLLNSLSALIEKLPQANLPADIKAIYIFGGMLREKERLHDLDAIFLYSQTEEQSKQWKNFWHSFNNLVSGGQEQSPLNLVWPLLRTYYQREIPLFKAVASKKLSKALLTNGINPVWAGCFSWTEIINNPRGIFIPFMDVVLQRMLLRNIKGLSAIFLDYESFLQGNAGYSKLNTVLAWSPEKPDIEFNIFGRNSGDKEKLILKEIGMFTEAISEQKLRYSDIRTRLIHGPVKLDFPALEQKHSEIVYSQDENYASLLEKCEHARNQMRNYEEEISVLNTIHSVFDRLEELKSNPMLENPIEEQVAYLTLLWQPKYKSKENRTRELLRLLGLPEEKVKTIKRPNSRTSYKLDEMRFIT